MAFDPITAAILGGTEILKLFGAHSAANAAKKAAETQSAAAQRALDYNPRLFGQQQQSFAPYQQAGTGAVNQLSSLLTGYQRPNVPSSIAGIVRPNTAPPASQMPMPTAQAPQGPPIIAPPGSTGLDDPRLARGTSPAIDTYLNQHGLQMPAGQVTLISPDGVHQMQFAQDDPRVAHYLQMGARRV